MITSSTLKEDSNSNNQFEASFVSNRGTDELFVSDELISNYPVSKARAEAIFLEQSYFSKTISFSTYHIDDVCIGDIISVDDILYKVESNEKIIKGAKASISITATRWE